MLIDAQGFIDGIGLMSKLPRPLALAGVAVLRTEQLRMVRMWIPTWVPDPALHIIPPFLSRTQSPFKVVLDAGCR